jgi:hypothetical protein
MVNLNLLQVSIGVMPIEQVLTRVGLLPIVASRDFAVLCEGRAIVFPNSSLVEADFSVIGWEKNNYGHNLTDFSFEDII